MCILAKTCGEIAPKPNHFIFKKSCFVCGGPGFSVCWVAPLGLAAGRVFSRCCLFCAVFGRWFVSLISIRWLVVQLVHPHWRTKSISLKMCRWLYTSSFNDWLLMTLCSGIVRHPRYYNNGWTCPPPHLGLRVQGHMGSPSSCHQSCRQYRHPPESGLPSAGLGRLPSLRVARSCLSWTNLIIP